MVQPGRTLNQTGQVALWLALWKSYLEDGLSLVNGEGKVLEAQEQ